MSARAPSLVVGVDGGGTGFRALVLDENGEERGRHQVPAAPVVAGSPGGAVSAVRAAVVGACDRAGVDLPLSALWAGITGAGREAVRAELEKALAGAGLARRVRVGTDVEAAFEDAFGAGPGLLVMAGTGSIAWGRGEDGRQGRVGGWGSLLGDEGSGYAIGLEALRRIARCADGRDPGTTLGARILARLGLAEPTDLIAWTSAAGRTEVAGLVPEVWSAAAAGDAVAEEVLARAVRELEGHVLTVLGTLGPWERPPTVALGGGLLGPGGPLREPMERMLQSHGLPILPRALDPAGGAASKAVALAKE